MKNGFVTLILIFLGFNGFAQKEDKKLQTMLTQLVRDFKGDVGIYVKNLKTEKVAQINADSLYPTASMIKVPIMCGVFNEIEKGNLSYKNDIIYKDSLYYPGIDIIGALKDGTGIALSKVQMLSITTSDNTASLWLQKLVGGAAINDLLAANGFENTRVNSRTEGRYPIWQKYGWGVTTPKEMAELVIRIRNGEMISEAASERMYRNLVRIYHDGEALSQIPPFVQAASKQGAVNASKSEVVLVNAPHGDYAFCIITNNQKDQRWADDNEGYVLIRKLSELLWNYYEPKYNWKPAKGIEKYR